MKVLIVDDDPDDITLYLEVLERIDSAFVIKTFTSAAGGLAFLTESHFVPDFILLDFNLPMMNGLEFVRHLRKDTIFKNFFVVVLTTACRPNDVESLGELGVKCYTKPSSIGDLERILRKIIATVPQHDAG